MSDKLGAVALEKRQNPVFVGMNANTNREYSESKAAEVDLEVDRLLTTAHRLALDILKKNKKILHAMAGVLLEYETINAKEVDLLMEGCSVEEFKKKKEEEIKASSSISDKKKGAVKEVKKEKDELALSKKKPSITGDPIIA